MTFSATRRFLRDRSGQFAMLTAIMAPVALTLAAFAVDAGSLYNEKRRAQSLADLAAISAASALSDPEAAALRSMSANGVKGIVLAKLKSDGSLDLNEAHEDQIVVVPGRYVAEPGKVVSGRFASGTPANAVKVIYQTKGTRYFAGLFMEAPDIVVAGIAAADPRAAFSVGSRLAALNSGLVNSLLGGLTGSSLSLSIMDYNALISADVSLLSFLKVLAVDLHMTAASFDEVLGTQVTFGQIAGALGKTGSLPASTKSALSKLRHEASTAGAKKLRLSQLIDLGQLGSKAANDPIDQLKLDVRVMQLLTASAVAAGNGRQVALDLTENLPGILSATVALAIGERPQSSPWLSYTERNGLVRTAQTRLKVTVDIGGPGGLLGKTIKLPIYLELAFAEARLSEVTCASGRPDSAKVTTEVRPGVADVYLADVDASKIANFGASPHRSPAKLIAVPLVTVSGTAHASIANTKFSPLTFKSGEIGNGTIKKVSTSTPVASLAASLFSGLALDVQIVGLGIGLPSNIAGTVGGLVMAAAPAVDTLLVGLLSTLGITIGEADVQAHGVSCGRPVLVQ